MRRLGFVYFEVREMESEVESEKEKEKEKERKCSRTTTGYKQSFDVNKKQTPPPAPTTTPLNRTQTSNRLNNLKLGPESIESRDLLPGIYRAQISGFQYSNGPTSHMCKLCKFSRPVTREQKLGMREASEVKNLRVNVQSSKETPPYIK